MSQARELSCGSSTTWHTSLPTGSLNAVLSISSASSASISSPRDPLVLVCVEEVVAASMLVARVAPVAVVALVVLLAALLLALLLLTLLLVSGSSLLALTRRYLLAPVRRGRDRGGSCEPIGV